MYRIASKSSEAVVFVPKETIIQSGPIAGRILNAPPSTRPDQHKRAYIMALSQAMSRAHSEGDTDEFRLRQQALIAEMGITEKVMKFVRGEHKRRTHEAVTIPVCDDLQFGLAQVDHVLATVSAYAPATDMQGQPQALPCTASELLSVVSNSETAGKRPVLLGHIGGLALSSTADRGFEYADFDREHPGVVDADSFSAVTLHLEAIKPTTPAA